MSFILDALRKSESERQQDARPSIARIPNAPPRHGLPGWAIATMAALGLGVVLMAGAWVKTLSQAPQGFTAFPSADQARGVDAEQGATASAARRAADAGVETYAGREVPRENVGAGTTLGGGSEQRRVETLSLPAPRPAGDASSPLAQVAQPPPLAMAARSQTGPRDGGFARDGARAGTTAGSATASAAAGAVSPSGTTAAGTSSATAAAGARSATRSTGEPLPAVEGIPDAYHSVASTLNLPPLTLELLAFVDNPAERFVFINGARYNVGDRLPGGAQIIAINSRGAVLLVNGRQLQLEPR